MKVDKDIHKAGTTEYVWVVDEWDKDKECPVEVARGTVATLPAAWAEIQRTTTGTDASVHRVRYVKGEPFYDDYFDDMVQLLETEDDDDDFYFYAYRDAGGSWSTPDVSDPKLREELPQPSNS